MSSHEIWPKSGGVPPSYEILNARTKGCVPDNVGIDPLPLGSDIYTGAGIPREKSYLFPEDRIAWLEENLAGRGWDITCFLDLATLICLSTVRRLVTYLPFILIDPNLRGIDLFKDICSFDVELCCTEDLASLIQATFQEREAELAQHSSSEDCVSESEYDQSDMSAPRSLSVPGRRERRLGKEPEPSGSAKKSRYASHVVLGLGSPNVSTSSTPSRPQQVPLVPTSASSLGENDFTTMIDEQMFQAMSREICEKTATLELRRNRIKECETELEQQQDELRNLRSGQSTVRMEVDRLK
ncbi:unnamed protein product [Prunus brigantina]